MAKILVTHPRVRVGDKLLEVGEQEVENKLAVSLVKRGLAKETGKKLEVATPKAAAGKK